MRKYRYYVAFIFSAFLGILAFFYIKNTLNLMEYITYNYEKTEDGYIPHVNIDYLSLFSKIGNISKEEMNQKTEGNILDSLSTLFLSDYSSVINSINVKTTEKPLKEGDYFNVEVTWDKDLSIKLGLNFASYNKRIKVISPEKNTISSIFEIKNKNEVFDSDVVYYTIVPLKNKDNKDVFVFNGYHIKNIKDNIVLLERTGQSLELDKITFNKYFVSNFFEIPEKIQHLNKDDFKFIFIISLLSFVLSIICFTICKKISKDDTLDKSYYLSYCMGILILLNMVLKEKISFKIPNNIDLSFISFIFILFIIISILFELITIFSLGNLKGIICFIFIILMNIFASITIYGIIGVILFIISTKFFNKKMFKKDKILASY